MRMAVFLALGLLLAGCRNSLPDESTTPQLPPTPVPVKPFQLGQPDLLLMITGHNSGMLELCNCRGPMAGGLSRRSGLVRSYRAAFPNSLLIDSGDLFWIEPETLKNDYVLKGYRQIGYDAVVLGDNEWMPSPSRLRSLLAAQDLPYLSTTINLTDPVHPLPLRREIVRGFGTLKVAILCAQDRESLLFMPADKIATLSFSPEEFANRARQFRDQGVTVIAVAHGSLDFARTIAQSGLADLVIRGHTGRSKDKLTAAWDDEEFPSPTPASATSARPGAPIVEVGGSEMIGVVALRLAKGRLQACEYRLEAADERWPGDKRLLQTYQAYAHAEMRRALDADRKEGLNYVPSSTCGACHRKQYEFWKKTPHARAYATLTRDGRQGDPNCLMCHTSGFGTAKGFYTIAKTPNLANVNCQDCHRFNANKHEAAKRPANEQVCTSCHTAITSPKFNYAAMKAKVACPK